MSKKQVGKTWGITQVERNIRENIEMSPFMKWEKSITICLEEGGRFQVYCDGKNVGFLPPCKKAGVIDGSDE